MAQPHRRVMTHRLLLLLKWLMFVIPPITVTVGHTLVMAGHSLRHDTVTGALATRSPARIADASRHVAAWMPACESAGYVFRSRRGHDPQ